MEYLYLNQYDQLYMANALLPNGHILRRELYIVDSGQVTSVATAL